ncbi:hypothetical protein ONZ45_g7614 [Pleurotus djamor]|nr:hypothetical protein ONZ45_g7614 [Pleurotus djamor]
MSSVASTLGAILLGNVAAAALYGVTTVQTVIYFSKPRDGFWIRSSILSLWLLDTAHTLLLTYSTYFYAVNNFNHSDALKNAVWTIWAQGHVTSVVDFIVRCLFTRRVWHVTHRNIWVVVVIISLSAVHLVAGSYLSTML